MIESMTMNPKSFLLRLLPGAALMLMLALAAATAPSVSVAADKKEAISHVIGKEIEAAQKALQTQQWAEALKNLDAAEAKSPLTPFDKKTIYQFKAFAYVKLGKLKDAQGEFEKMLATGDVSPEEKTNTIRALFSITGNTGQYQKAIDYGKDIVDAGTAKPDDLAIMAQSYYQLKDCKNAVVYADKSIAASRKAGETPKDSVFLFKLQCASDAGDNAAMSAVLMDLIRLSGKTQCSAPSARDCYWNTLLRIERQSEREDANTRMIYRIMYNTNSMNADTDYIEMAQLLGDAGLPGEAASVLDKAISSGIMKDEHKERTQRLLASLKTRADSDRKGIAQEDTEAAKNPSGEASVKIGEVYYGFGDYQKAADAINRGLQKGQVKHLDEAYVYLGLSDVQLKNIADAKKAFGNLKSVPNISPRVVKLWELYSDTLR